MQFCVTFIPLWEIFFPRTYRVWSEFWILSPIRRLVQAIAVFSLEIQRCCFFTASHIPQQRNPCAEVRQPQADCLASGRGLILAGSQEEFNSFKYDLIWLDHSLWPPTIFNQHQSTHGTPRSTFFSGWVTSCNKSPQRIGWMAAVQFGVLWSLPARWISLDVQCFTVSIAGSTSR
jgi:hypothetical protein